MTVYINAYYFVSEEWTYVLKQLIRNMVEVGKEMSIVETLEKSSPGWFKLDLIRWTNVQWYIEG